MKDIFSVEGKVIIITGGSGFLGKQYCEFLRGRGATVVNWDLGTKVDVMDFTSVNKATKAVVKKFGRIDVLINNAAFNTQVGSGKNENSWAPYEVFSSKLWSREIDINLKGQMLPTQAVVCHMIQQKFGSIIFIASDLAIIGPQNRIYDAGKFKDIAYITSKAGVLGLMRSWAAYLGSYNIRVNAFVPGGMYRNQPEDFVRRNSELNMLNRMSKVGEYNGPIVFLASDASSYMTGACLIVDGGRTAW
ncbi:MAG: SDR family oxidoreductase [bacterium]|nr:SDR family oxidoreductase [bacterium]